MAPPLLVVTPTKGHVGWDEPVRDSVVYLPHSGRSPRANRITEPQWLECTKSTCIASSNLPVARRWQIFKDAHPNTAVPIGMQPVQWIIQGRQKGRYRQCAELADLRVVWLFVHLDKGRDDGL